MNYRFLEPVYTRTPAEQARRFAFRVSTRREGTGFRGVCVLLFDGEEYDWLETDIVGSRGTARRHAYNLEEKNSREVIEPEYLAWCREWQSRRYTGSPV